MKGWIFVVIDDISALLNDLTWITKITIKKIARIIIGSLNMNKVIEVDLNNKIIFENRDDIKYKFVEVYWDTLDRYECIFEEIFDKNGFNYIYDILKNIDKPSINLKDYIGNNKTKCYGYVDDNIIHIEQGTHRIILYKYHILKENLSPKIEIYESAR
jgi:hypothetical protein